MREVTINDLAEALVTDVTVVDVREPFEYAGGHVPGALLIPMGHLPARLHDLDRTRPVFVICATGNRSLAMRDYLAGAGFNAVSVAGGTSAWTRAGRPIERGLHR